jgi:glycosyltransferase involved in cell wall biosynthesis
MRVAYDARLAARGLGIATFVRELATALVATGEVELIWLGDPALAPAGAARWLRADRPPYPLLDGAAGRALAARLGADVVHFTGNTGWARPGTVASVLTLHDLIFLGTGIRGRSARQIVGHRYERWLVPHAARAADVLTTSSQTIAEEIVGRLHPLHAPVVIADGVLPPPGYRASEVSQPPYIVAFAGRDPRKQTEAVVSAWREFNSSAATSSVRLQLLAAGGMPPGLRESLAPELAAGSVEIHAHLPREQLWSLLGAASALVYPSSDEGFGLPLLEGMAAGVPVLGGIAAVTRDVGGDALIRLDGGDIANSIVVELRRLLADPGEAELIRERGRARALQYSWSATARAFIDAYHLAISRHRDARRRGAG